MADIRVTCPACKTQLEIGAEFEGQEVECGTCLEVFTASTKKTKPKGGDPDKKSESGGGKIKGSTSRKRSSRDRDEDDDDRPARRRRDDDDDDDDYDHDYRPSRRQSGGSNGLAITSLILGILSILCLLGSCLGGAVPIAGCCCGLGSLGGSLGAIITGAIGMKNPQGKGMATGGLVLGVLTLLAIIVLFVIGFVIGFGGAMNGGGPNQFR